MWLFQRIENQNKHIMLRSLLSFRPFVSQKSKGLSEMTAHISKQGLYRNISGGLEAENNPVDKEKKLKIFELEIDVSRQEGRRVPDPALMKDEHWEHLLSLNSRSARTKYYAFLWQLERKKDNRERKKIQKHEELIKRKEDEKKQNEESNHIIYALTHTSLFLRIYDTTMNLWNNNKLIQAMQFGEKIVLDCSYDKYMNKRESVNAGKQLMLCFAENRMHDEPFDLHYCNVNMRETAMHYLGKHIPTMMETSFPMNLHEQCYTDIFPKERLVYLTPHCNNDLLKYNPDDIYVVGAMVDKMNSEPISLAKAKKLGLRMAKFPLDRYLQWTSGSGKSLTINQVLHIMLDMKKTGDWGYALRHVPRRKIVNLDHQLNEVDEETNTREIIKKLRSTSEKLKFDVDSWGNSKRYKTR